MGSLAALRTARLLIVALTLFGFAALGAPVQDHYMRLPIVKSEPLPEGAEAGSLVRQVRNAMRMGQYGKARKLAEESKGILINSDVGYTRDAREVLAETAVLENRPAEALAQIAPLPAYTVNQRLEMTKALALIELGELTQARALVLEEVGTPKRPGPMRDGWGLYHVPVDENASVGALTATAYVIRATWRSNPIEYPEMVADLRAALRLTPDDPTIHLRYAEALIELGAYAEAKTELDRAAAAKTGAGANPRFQKRLQKMCDRRLETMKQFPNGRPKPDADGATKP